jgi:hypothetical protein
MPSLNPAGRVVPDIADPLLQLLGELGLADAVALLDTYAAAAAAHAEALDTINELEDELADRPAAAKRAGLTGAKPPTSHPTEFDDGRREAARLKARAAEQEARKAAAALEAAVVEARAALRARLVEQLAADHAAAVAKHDEAVAADARQRATASTIRGLDLFTARRLGDHPHDANTLEGAVHEHYHLAVDSQDPSRFREHVIAQGLRDTAARVRSLPVDGFTADPFASAVMKAAESMVQARRDRASKPN